MELYTVKQAARRLNCSTRWVQLLIKRGLLVAEGDGHNRVIPAAVLDAYERGTPRDLLAATSAYFLQPIEDPSPEPPIDFDVAGQLGELLAQIKLRAEEIDFGKLGAGLQEEIMDAGAKFAHALYRGAEAQKKRRLLKDVFG